MKINGHNVTNEINNLTYQNAKDTQWNGISIGISAYSGGMGRDDILKFSARKAVKQATATQQQAAKTACKEGTAYNTRETHTITSSGKVNYKPNKTIVVPTSTGTKTEKRQIVYDYVYDNINLGLTPREIVKMSLVMKNKQMI